MTNDKLSLDKTPKGVDILQDKFLALESELNTFIYERDSEIRGMVLAILSRQHIFQLGVAGTAKSYTIIEAKKRIVDAKYFELLFTRFTEPNEVFGAVKLTKLKQDIFERNIKGMLPDSHFAYLDEIFKANSSILNSLLTILNERKFDNGGVRVDCPLITMLGASNELPEDRSVLDALWDRLLIKFVVSSIGDDTNFMKLLDDATKSDTVRLSLGDIEKAQLEAEKVSVPDEVKKAIINIRKKLRHEGIMPSDRRYKKALTVIKANAWLRGVDTATVDDLSVLTFILWDNPEQIPKVEEIVMELSNPLQRQADELHDAIWRSLRDTENVSEDDKMSKVSQEGAKVRRANKSLDKIRVQMVAEGRDITKVDSYIKEAVEMNDRLMKLIMA